MPTINGLNELLYKYHVNTCHSNYKEIRELFTKNNIGYKEIDKLLEEYVSHCPVCCQTTRTLHRTDPIKSINVNGPDYRYVFDITYLKQDMSKCFGIKYLLSILDAFSWKTMIYETNSKKSDILLKYVIEFCLNNKIPKEFLLDNGDEFKNFIFNEFCNIYDIKFLHGHLIHPIVKALLKGSTIQSKII